MSPAQTHRPPGTQNGLNEVRQGAHNAARRLQRAAEVLPFVRA